MYYDIRDFLLRRLLGWHLARRFAWGVIEDALFRAHVLASERESAAFWSAHRTSDRLASF